LRVAARGNPRPPLLPSGRLIAAVMRFQVLLKTFQLFAPGKQIRSNCGSFWRQFKVSRQDAAFHTPASVRRGLCGYVNNFHQQANVPHRQESATTTANNDELSQRHCRRICLLISQPSPCPHPATNLPASSSPAAIMAGKRKGRLESACPFTSSGIAPVYFTTQWSARSSPTSVPASLSSAGYG